VWLNSLLPEPLLLFESVLLPGAVLLPALLLLLVSRLPLSEELPARAATLARYAASMETHFVKMPGVAVLSCSSGDNKRCDWQRQVLRTGTYVCDLQD
jgi:hypothetical protein